MRGCELEKNDACKHEENHISLETMQICMAAVWAEKYDTVVDPKMLQPRCKNWRCSRADHWQRKRRKQSDRPSDKEHKKMMLLVATGTSQAVVAHIFGVTQQAVSRFWQSFVPNYRHRPQTGGDRKGNRFSKRVENARRRAIEKIYTKEKKA